MVYEARGENQAAADCYRKVIAFIRAHPDDYDPAFEDKFVKLVNKLDPPLPDHAAVQSSQYPKATITHSRWRNTRSILGLHGHAESSSKVREKSFSGPSDDAA
jgi:hypothetical protein